MLITPFPRHYKYTHVSISLIFNESHENSFLIPLHFLQYSLKPAFQIIKFGTRINHHFLSYRFNFSLENAFIKISIRILIVIIELIPLIYPSDFFKTVCIHSLSFYSNSISSICYDFCWHNAVQSHMNFYFIFFFNSYITQDLFLKLDLLSARHLIHFILADSSFDIN